MARRAAGARFAALILAGFGLGAGCATPPPDIPVVPVDGWDHAAGRVPTPGPNLDPSEAALLNAVWEMIVAGRLGSALEQMEPLRTSNPGDPGVLAADGFLQLRSGHPDDAETLFAQALEANPDDGLAALGAAITVLHGSDTETLFRRLVRLQRIEPDAPLALEWIPLVRLDVAEARLSRARELARGDGAGAAVTAAYHALIEVLPDSGDILLEAAEAAERAGDPKAAQRWFDEVAVLPGTGQALAMAARLSAAELLAEQDRSLESLERLDVILGDPFLDDFEDLRARAETLALRLEIARHDRQLTQIRETERVTREQLAAVLIAELGEPESQPSGPAAGAPERWIAIDLEGTWAAGLIRRSIRAGYLSLFPDHTFKPRDFVTRAELAESLAAALRVLEPDLHEDTRRGAAGRDVPGLPAGHRNRDAAAVCLSLGLLRLEGGGFRPRDFASGAEAVRAIQALRRQRTPS